MLDENPRHVANPEASFHQQIAATEARKMKVRRHPTPSAWLGLGMMGLIGWSVTIPTLLCVALGAWLDRHYPGNHNWTLALLAVGLALGCFTAWRWVANEARSMQDPLEEGDE
jgi:ATP synthase protein I